MNNDCGATFGEKLTLRTKFRAACRTHLPAVTEYNSPTSQIEQHCC